MIDYIEQLSDEEKEQITEVIRLLYRQTFILERKYDRRAEKWQYSREYKICDMHMEFLKEYFQVAGIELVENIYLGVIYIRDGMLMGEKIPRLATIYILVLKILYDEQMAQVSSSTRIVTTLGAVNGKAGEFQVMKSLPSPTEIRRSIALLKKYQIIEPLDILEELNEGTRMIIYPTINMVLTGDDIRALLKTFGEEENSGDETGVQNIIEDLSE